MLVTLGIRPADAHKPVTSRYDYNRDVFPLLRDHCGRCHVEGGVAPMSLMTYKDAFSWGESIRDQLTAGRMPPWPIDPRSPAVKGMHPISARDVDVIVTWAAGGTPRDWSGDIERPLPTVAVPNQWRLGPPDLVVSMESQYTLAANDVEEKKDFSMPSGITEVKWVRAADLLPETPTIVRDAIISVENGPTLALWQPGSDPLAAPSGAAFRVTPGAKLHLQIHYKKPYTQEQDTLSDRSRIGLYFTDSTGVWPRASVDFDEREEGERRVERRPDSCGDAAGRRTRPRVAADARQGIRQRRHRRRDAERHADSAVEAARPAPAVVPPVLAAGGHRAPGRERHRGALHPSWR